MERKQWIILIIVLVVCAVLYLAVTVFGLAKNDRAQSMDAIQAGVAGTLQKWLGGLAPKIDGARLQCNGQRLDKVFRLGNGAGNDRCNITIYPSGDEYRKATLELVDAPPSVEIYIASDRMDEQQAEGIEQTCIPYTRVQSAPGLELYFPGKWADDPATACWSTAKRSGSQPPSVDIVAMKEGGHLTLVCRWCAASTQRRLNLSFK